MTISTGAHDLVINVMLQAEETKTVKIRATTKGGKTMEKEVEINVNPTV